MLSSKVHQLSTAIRCRISATQSGCRTVIKATSLVPRPAVQKNINIQRRQYVQHKYATHSSRTSITSQLWEKRLRSEEEQLKKLHEQGVDAAQINSALPSFILDKKPSDSHVEVTLPLGTDLALREQYINFYGNVRFERLLEDLDACAGNIAYLHAEDNNPLTRPLTIVTASVDRIDLLNKLHADRDVKMQGCVSYVGRSSMEVRIEVQAKDPLGVNKWDPLILATFSMVATCNGKAAPVNRLVPTTEQEKRLFAIGEMNKQRRAEQAKQSLSVQPPTEDERLIIHEMFVMMQKKQPKKMTAEELKLFRAKQQEFLQKYKHNNFRPLAPEDTPEERLLIMSDTKLQSVVVCQPQERNMKNMIFGGYLMRKAAELAWTSAHIHCGVRPWFLALDSVSFHKGVEIGSMLIFNSEVIFSTPHTLGIKVIAEVLNPRENTRDVTTSFHFTFTCPDGIVDKVVPNTYEEAMKYLEGKRRYEFGKQVAKEIGSKLAKFYL